MEMSKQFEAFPDLLGHLNDYRRRPVGVHCDKWQIQLRDRSFPRLSVAIGLTKFPCLNLY